MLVLVVTGIVSVLTKRVKYFYVFNCSILYLNSSEKKTLKYYIAKINDLVNNLNFSKRNYGIN